MRFLKREEKIGIQIRDRDRRESREREIIKKWVVEATDGALGVDVQSSRYRALNQESWGLDSVGVCGSWVSQSGS